MHNDEAIVYHKPSCSTCRAVIKELKDNHGLALREINYFESKFSPEELGKLIRAMGKHPREVMRTGEEKYIELGLDREELGEEELIRAMAENPELIERPIVVYGDRVVLARPPEEMHKMFGTGLAH